MRVCVHMHDVCVRACLCVRACVGVGVCVCVGVCVRRRGWVRLFCADRARMWTCAYDHACACARVQPGRAAGSLACQAEAPTDQPRAGPKGDPYIMPTSCLRHAYVTHPQQASSTSMSSAGTASRDNESLAPMQLKHTFENLHGLSGRYGQSKGAHTHVQKHRFFKRANTEVRACACACHTDTHACSRCSMHMRVLTRVSRV